MRVLYDGNPFARNKGEMKKDEAVEFIRGLDAKFYERCGFKYKGAWESPLTKEKAIDAFYRRSDSGIELYDDKVVIQTWSDIDYY